MCIFETCEVSDLTIVYSVAQASRAMRGSQANAELLPRMPTAEHRDGSCALTQPCLRKDRVPRRLEGFDSDDTGTGDAAGHYKLKTLRIYAYVACRSKALGINQYSSSPQRSRKIAA